LINKNCWIGGLVFIGKGVEIGEGSIIAAGSKVVKNVEKKIVFKNKI
jgi:acetyltransferase-like isoleucine patch superfamily enzyme